MNFLKRLFSSKATADKNFIVLAPSRGFTFDIVGEAGYQRALSRIVGGKQEHGAKHKCEALLHCEVENPHDPNAVCVKINGLLVGYLARDEALNFRSELAAINSNLPPCAVAAKIVGGWKSEDSEGHFGVKLNLKRPLTLKKN